MSPRPSKGNLPRSRRQYVVNSPALELAQEVKGIRYGLKPDFVEPCLATLVDVPPSTENWVHEIKFDGYRAEIHKTDAGTQIFTRRGHDWKQRFLPIVSAVGELKTHGVIIDGEAVVEINGRSEFGALQDDLGAGRTDRMVFYAFDVLYLDGVDLRNARLIDRKRVLAELLADVSGTIRYSEHLETSGLAMLKNACQLGLEGIVSKLRDARYQSKRNTNWVKVTCRNRDTFQVVGYALKNGKFDGLYLGRKVGRDLVYAGKVEHGFTDKSAKGVVERLRPLLTRAQAVSQKVKKPKAQWVKPKMLAEVEYRAITEEGKLRHPSFKGLREDLSRTLPLKVRSRGPCA